MKKDDRVTQDDEFNKQIASLLGVQPASTQRQPYLDEQNIPAEDNVQLLDKTSTPVRDFGVLSRDVKTANLDFKTAKEVSILLSIAKDFDVFDDAFDLENDGNAQRWIKATQDAITGDAIIKCCVSQGLKGKLLDMLVTSRRVTQADIRQSPLEKKKRFGIFG